MANRDDDKDEGELREQPPHTRGLTQSEAADDPKKKTPPRRIDDPDPPRSEARTVKVGNEEVEVIEDLDARTKEDDKPARRERDERRDEGADDRADNESRSRRRRMDRREGRDRDRAEMRQLLEKIGGLEKTVELLAKGQRGIETQTEAQLLANTKAALNSVLNQRAQALEAGDGARANELDEAAYRLRRDRDDLERSIAAREKNGGAERKETDGGERRADGEEAARPRWTPGELKIIRTFCEDEIPWFDPAGGDRDSREALDISAEMGEDGWRPSDPGWADELKGRLKEALPDRFEDDREDQDGRRRPPTRKAPPVGSRGREGGAGGGKRQFRLTPIHKQTLADSGHEPGSPEYDAIIAAWINDAAAERKSR